MTACLFENIEKGILPHNPTWEHIGLVFYKFTITKGVDLTTKFFFFF